MQSHHHDTPTDFADLDAECAEAVGFSDLRFLNTSIPSTFEISIFQTHKSKTCINKTLSLSDLISHVAVHKLGDKEGTSWSPTCFLNGQRSSENAATCQLAVLDIDHNGPAPQLLAAKMKALGVGGFVVSSHSHTIDETRLRVIIFSVPWAASNYDSLDDAKGAFHEGLKALAKALGVEGDIASMEPARLFFDPRNRPGFPKLSLLVDGAKADVWPRPLREKNDMGEDFSNYAFEENGPLDCSPADFVRMVMHVKNDDRFDRKAWLAMLAGIKHQLGDDGYDLAEKWSASWTGGEHDPQEAAKAWRSLKQDKVGGATAKTVRKFAIRDGWVDADGGSDQDRFAVYGDLWNGRQFAHDHRGRLLYVESSGIWYVKQGSRFVSSPSAEVDQAAKATSERLLEQAFAKASDPSDSTKKQVNKAIALQTSLPAIRKMIEAAKSEPGMSISSPDRFDQDPFALLVDNGVLNLKTGTLRETRPGELFAKQAGTKFDPLAMCPTFDKFLKQVQPNDNDRAYIQRAVGYTLLGLVDEEVMFFVTGIGANGKSVLANILSALFGDYCRVVSSSLLTKSKYDSDAERQKVALIGTRLALMNETSKNDVWDDQRVKELVSREKVTVRMLYHETIDVTPTHKFWVRSNHSPGAQDGGDGFWRRIELIPFAVQLEREAQIPDLDRKIIRYELAGVLNWALAGCLDFQSQRLKTPKHLEALKDEYRGETDLVGQWLQESTIADQSARTSIADAYSSYRTFCEVEGHRYVEVKSQFSRQMTQKGFQRGGGTAVRKFVGFKLVGWGEKNES